MNKYVQNHDFGSWESDKTINKLRIRDIEDLRVYLDELIAEMYGEGCNTDSIQLNDGKTYSLDLAVNE